MKKENEVIKMTDNILLEQKALSICEKNQNKLYVYTGSDIEKYGKTGYFEIVQDMNCCAPSDRVLFCFQTKDRRFVMDAHDLIDTFEHSEFI